MISKEVLNQNLLENTLADYARLQELQGKPFVLKDFFDTLNGIGNIPISLVHWQITGSSNHLKIINN